MGIQPAMVGAAQGVERSEFKHDRLLKGSSWGSAPGPRNKNRWLMACIIYQAIIDKKRKKCLKTIDLVDAK
ncbi:hypothetical protein [Pseudomonas sp. ANT_J12]|uniref:hypothetical protein n=1 Tax=Pseudomonas sp. ANT_J12 TaxID=2597351 RepID=UPI0015B391EA|nr:hypothetical protein [Pseudomonas sp. ANT_J12]